jgi:tetratricopeptide (TPR) repeat protein
MRKILCLVLIFGAASLAFAQDKFFTSETAHYRISSETSQSQADEISRTMEACLVAYNSIFHFDLSQLPGKLQVKVFKDVDSFNAYLDKLLSQTRTDFVFVAYSDPSKSELLAFTKDASSFLPSLIHQGCIQLLKAYIANPPVWLREGVATYLETSVYDSKSGTLTYKANIQWLDPLKAIQSGSTTNTLIPISDLLLLTREAAQQKLDVFYPEAWGFVSFLLDSPDKADNRLMWDAISALDPKASLEENSQRVRRQAFSWFSEQSLAKNFETYIATWKTPQDLLREGVDFYAKGDLDKSEKSFTSSLEQEPDSNAAYYYLGLIAYARKDYAKADQMYVQAAKLGMSGGLVDYALGVNAFAGGKLTDAANYLKLSKDAEPATYGEKVDTLLKRIDAMKTAQ